MIAFPQINLMRAYSDANFRSIAKMKGKVKRFKPDEPDKEQKYDQWKSKGLYTNGQNVRVFAQPSWTTALGALSILF